MDTPTPILCYGRSPARCVAGEHVRTVNHSGGTTVAVFPPGVRRCDFLSMLAGSVVVASLLTAATLQFYFHPVPLRRYVAAVWPLGVMLLFFLAMLGVAYDEAYRQVEFEVDAEEITRLSFGPFGPRRRRWRRRDVHDVRVETHISGSHPRVVLLMRNGRSHDVLCPGSSRRLRDHADDVASQLRSAIGFKNLL